MPDRDVLTADLGDGYELIAAGLRREKGDLAADLMLKNGDILAADPCVLTSANARLAWCEAAVVEGGPTAFRMATVIVQKILPQALAQLQEEPKRPTQADQLVGMVSALLGDFATDVAGAVELFHDPGGTAYATIPVGGHKETHPLRSRGFREWMARRYHEQHEKTPNTQALVDATAVLAGKALYDGPERAVHVRVAGHDGAVYVDLCDAEWRAVAITATGWRVIASPPVKFRRTRGSLPLPVPMRGGSLEDLKPFLNLPRAADGTPHQDAWFLVAGWLVAALRPTGPYPLLDLDGEQGSAKSSMSRVARLLIDPNKAPIRTMPRDERDLMISASNAWVLAYDNLSHLHDWQSDALCRIATGGGFAARELYSDQDETILDAQRPVVVNGIGGVATRADLLDRAIVLTLPQIPDRRRRPEAAFWRDFEAIRPLVLGALYDAVAAALANEATTVLDGHPRMADAAVWVTAAEEALGWKAGSFVRAYVANRADANDLALEASPVVPGLRAFVASLLDGSWSGTSTELLRQLEARADDAAKRLKSWPGNPKALSDALIRLAPNLRQAGIDVEIGKSGGKRYVKVERAPETEQEGE